MSKLIYFDEKNHLVKSFCGEDSEYATKSDFSQYPERYQNSIAVCYGLSNYGEILVAKKNNIQFIYIDNCYFGSLNSHHTNLKPKKVFYRIVANDLVLHKIIPRPADRYNKQIKFLRNNYGFKDFYQEPKRDGYNIIIIPPSGKINYICNIDVDKWIEKATRKIKKQSDVNITIKTRPKSRYHRFTTSSIYDYLQDAYAVVTFSSMAAVETVAFGVPSFIYNNNLELFHSAAEPVSRLGLDNIINRFYPNNRKEWLYHLAYGQFSKEEIANGFARNFILESMI